jgi:hypothetical protein
MISLQVDSAGRLLVWIADSKEEVWAYAVEATVDAIALTHQHTGECHELRRIAEGWACSCNAYKFRARYGKTTCKHGDALSLLSRFGKLLEDEKRGELALGVERGIRSSVFDEVA